MGTRLLYTAAIKGTLTVPCPGGRVGCSASTALGSWGLGLSNSHTLSNLPKGRALWTWRQTCFRVLGHGDKRACASEPPQRGCSARTPDSRKYTGRGPLSPTPVVSTPPAVLSPPGLASAITSALPLRPD
eukprot:867890-Prorocentrum_minimum.AAC.1